MNVMMGNTIKMARAIVPKDVNDWEILKVSPCNVKEGLCKGERSVRVKQPLDLLIFRGRVTRVVDG